MKRTLYILQFITALATVAALYGITKSPVYIFWAACGIFLFLVNRRNIRDIEEEETA